MFTGDDDLLNLIQIEANTLVDTILDESVSIVNNSTTNQSSFNPPPSSHDIDYDDYGNDEDEQQQEQLSHEVSYEDNSFEQPQPPSQLPLINIDNDNNTNNNNNNNDSILSNNNSNNNPLYNEQAPISDEISENFAIKSDYDIIVKSPTIESMSGKSFEDVDDDINYTASSAINDVSLDNVSALHSNDNITATNITPTTSVQINSDTETFIESVIKNDQDIVRDIYEEEVESASDNENIEDIVQVEARKLVDEVIQESLLIIDQNDQISNVHFGSVTFAQESIDTDYLQSPDNFDEILEEEDEEEDVDEDDEFSNDNAAIVRNLDEHKLHRVERKFEHLSSEVRDDDPATVEDLINKDEISTLQTDFSKISWDESLSATTGDFASSTPENDLQDVLNVPGDTYRNLHNK